MKAKKKLGFLMDVAEMAFNNGADLTVELRDYRLNSNTIGKLSCSATVDTGIVLRAYHPTEANDTAEEDDDE